MLKWSMLNFSQYGPVESVTLVMKCQINIFQYVWVISKSSPLPLSPARLTVSLVEHVSVKQEVMLHCTALPKSSPGHVSLIKEQLLIIFKNVLILSLFQLGLGLTCILNAAWDTARVFCLCFKVVLSLRQLWMHVQAYNLILDGRMLLLKRNSRGKGSVKVLYEGGDQTMIRSWCRHRVERLEEEMGLHLFPSFLRTVRAEQIIKGYQTSSGSLRFQINILSWSNPQMGLCQASRRFNPQVSSDYHLHSESEVMLALSLNVSHVQCRYKHFIVWWPFVEWSATLHHLVLNDKRICSSFIDTDALWWFKNCIYSYAFCQTLYNSSFGFCVTDSKAIVDGNLKLILGLIWTLILHYSISMPMWDEEEETEASKQKTPKQRLLGWIQNKLPELPITNFSRDWQSGKALGALVDSCAPGERSEIVLGKLRSQEFSGLIMSLLNLVFLFGMLSLHEWWNHDQ